MQAKVKAVADLVWSNLTGSMSKDAQHVQVRSVSLLKPSKSVKQSDSWGSAKAVQKLMLHTMIASCLHSLVEERIQRTMTYKGIPCAQFPANYMLPESRVTAAC